MTKLISLLILAHIIAAGFFLERRGGPLSSRTLVKTAAYFSLVFVAYAYTLRLFPDWIDPSK